MDDGVGAVGLQRQRLDLRRGIDEVDERLMVLAVLLPPGDELCVHQPPGDHLAGDLANDAQLARGIHQALVVHDLQLGCDVLELERRDHGCEGLALRTDQLVTVPGYDLGQTNIDVVDTRLDRRNQRVVVSGRNRLRRLEVGVLAVELHLQSKSLLGKRVDEVENLGIDVCHVNHLLVVNELSYNYIMYIPYLQLSDYSISPSHASTASAIANPSAPRSSWISNSATAVSAASLYSPLGSSSGINALVSPSIDG